MSRTPLALPRALALALTVVALPAAAGSTPAAASSAPRPTYQVVDLDAIKTLIHNGRGHVVLVHFWASWCGPCLQELPVIDKLARELKPRGLEVLSLSLDDPRLGARVGALLHKMAPTLTPAIAKFDDADGFISAFDPRWQGAIPALFVYDQQGQPRGTMIGESTRRELEQLVGRLLDAPAPARAGPPAPPRK